MLVSSPELYVARAKINLHLHITGRRDDGYHYLDSLVAFTDLHDTISVSPAASYQLHITGTGQSFLSGCDIEDNLVTKAARLFAKQFHVAPNVLITLDKHIPSGGGLGGGSADAAATLIALRDFWNIPATNRDLHHIASQIGSDIVACLHPEPVIMCGTGNDILSAPRFPILYAVLAGPRSPCPTPLVYKAYAHSGVPFSEPAAFPDFFDSAFSFCTFLKTCTRNDLTQASIAVNPDVAGVIAELETLSDALLVRLSGSGSTCFALFETEDKARLHATQINKNRPDVWAVAVKIG